ncbi:RDD family protein [Flavobacterium sp. MXW15]|uniref:RDD family protein n=1 Tax=Xanthomonas chitinilytica TaxID=2989819 RepID=A0ABT3K0A5_9XANT|nr:RDD family protein [Xanthomonas sp. H13-6]MCW4456455.1 RDD family protein [Flavobacterium sp. MXW15]MCW4474165.1 RDD family protein [Xanthomonas sp. H13-6]
MSEWYYADAQRQRHGPIATETLRGQFQRGEMTLASLVWREGLSEWKPLSDFVDELGLQNPATASTGVDLRGDYSAIENGTATYTPYAAPAAALRDDSNVVLGGEVVYAGFWKRVAAYFIDSIIVGIVGGVIGMVIGAVMGIGFAGMGDNMAGAGFILIQLVTNLLSIALAAAYYAGFHASVNRATPGKMAVGIKVVRLNGERISIARGIGRYFAALLSGLILCIGYVMAAFTERKQGLHDMLCDTLVVDKWAFTEHPEWQQRGLGTVTIVVLAIFGVLLAIGVFAILAVIGIAASQFN